MVSPAIALKRIQTNNAREFNRLDREEMSLHQKVYKGYQSMIKKFPKALVVIDASKPLDEVIKDVKKAIDKKLKVYDK